MGRSPSPLGPGSSPRIFYVACRILNVPFEKQLRRVSRELEAAKKRRDDLIVRASDVGMSRRAVAAATGLSLARVQQIVAARREGKLASRADQNAASATRLSVGRVRETIAGRRMRGR
jgi:hypothetical protein